jgi:dTDP-4-dehydrorhamnose reductase
MFRTRILVTGANGLLGQALVRRLSGSPDHEVVATARNDDPRFDVPCEYTPMDVTTPDEVTAVVEDFAPDVVVNCAAVSDVAECDENRNRAWAVNARAVRTLAKQCRATDAHLVQVSSDFVFNGKNGPYDERARPDPVNYYGRTKLAGENVLREFDFLDWAIVRTVLLYGTAKDLSRSNVVLWIIDQLSKGEVIHVVNDQWRTPTFAPDLADGIVRLVDREKTGIYHLSGREMVTIDELAQTVAQVFDFDTSLIDPVPSHYFENAVERPSKTGFIILKAETELDYDPRPLEEGLRTVGQELDLLSTR